MRENDEEMQQLMEKCADSLDEQVRQGRIIGKAMLAAIKHHCRDFVIPGLYSDPTPALMQQTKHILPSNDYEEHDLSYVDCQVHKNRKQRIERTDAKLKIKEIKVVPFLKKLPRAKRCDAWDAAGKALPQRLALEKERREQDERKRIENMTEKVKKSERKAKKRKEKKQEFKAVEVVRTLDDLKSMLKGLSSKLATDFLRKQCEQLTTVYGVSTHILPRFQNGKPLAFDALYKNLSALLEKGDPFAPETAARLKSKQIRKRGRSATSSTKERKAKKQKVDD